MPYNATSRKGVMRGQVDRAFLQAHKEGKVRVAIGRAADFYGPRVTNSSFGYTVFPAVLNEKPAQVLGNMRLPHVYSYIKDVARGLATLGAHEEALGKEWLLPAAPAISVREMLDLVQDELGMPVRALSIPKIAVQAVGLFNPTIRELVEMFYQYTEAQIIDSSKFEAAFGWKATPLKQGIRETVDWFQKNK
jgi:nucleoside-diphosphate-sugar epimerase